MKKFFSLIAAVLFAGSMFAADEVVYTLTPTAGSNNAYANNCDIEISGITWNLTGNSQMNPWRIGGKNLSEVDRALYSKTAMEANVTKIEIEHGAAANITVNSMTVIVASDASFATVISTLTPEFAASGKVTVERPEGKDWSDAYYKIVYNVSVSGNSNKFIEFVGAEFFAEEGSGPEVVKPVIAGNAVFQDEVEVSITCDTEDADIYYTLDGSDPDESAELYEDPFVLTESAVVKAIAIKGEAKSAIVEKEFTAYPSQMTCAEARVAALSVSTNNEKYAGGLTFKVRGYVTSIATAWSSTNKNISFWMADAEDGGQVLQAYRAACATEADAPAVGDAVEVVGTLTKYGTTPEFSAGCTFTILEDGITTAIDNTNATEKAVKVFENGQLVIIKNGVRYNALGVQL